MTAVRVDVEYLSPEWYAQRRQGLAASEIAAVLGLSPYTSRFDLWWHKRGGVDSQRETPSMSRGKRLEALVLEDFEDAHPEFVLAQPGLIRHPTRTWQLATPDALAYESPATLPGEPVAVVEAKTAGARDGWGEPGTGDVPLHYRCQALWQLDVTELGVCYVPVWFGTTYAEYVVEADPADQAYMRAEGERFLESVAEGTPPEIDSHTATTRRLKQLHPAVTDEAAEVPATVVRQYQMARRVEKAAADRKRLAENRIRNALGTAQRGTVAGAKVLSRSVTEVPEALRAAHTRDALYVTQKEIT